MKKKVNYGKFIYLTSVNLLLMLMFWFIFNFFFFVILGNISVDGLIAVSLIIFLYVSYKYVYEYLYNYFWNISKTITIYYINLFQLMILLKKLSLSLMKSYLRYLKHVLIELMATKNEILLFWKDLNKFFFKKYLINNVLRLLSKQLLMLKKRKLTFKRFGTVVCLFGFSENFNKVLNFKLNVSLSYINILTCLYRNRKK